MTEEITLLSILEPIDPSDQVTRVPGIEAPCLCEPGRKDDCEWPWCKPDPERSTDG